MRIAVAAALFAISIVPACAEDASSADDSTSSSEQQVTWDLPPYDMQQSCYTWISLTAGFGEPDTIRPKWTHLAYLISSALSRRTDTPPEKAKPIEDHEIKIANDWIMKYQTGPIEERVRMITEAMENANNCLDMVPPENWQGPGT